MDPVSNVDQLVMLLRQRLLERSKSTASPRKSGFPSSTKPPFATVQALAAVESLDDRELRRALVQHILADRFGRPLINDARFQQVVDKVTETMQRDRGASRLLERMVGELRASAR